MVLPLRVAVAATEPSADITVPKTAKRSLALAQSACSPYEWRLAVRPPKRGLESVPSGDGRLFAKLHTIFMVGHTAGIPPIVFRCHTLKKWEMLTATYLAVSVGSHQSSDTNILRSLESDLGKQDVLIQRLVAVTTDPVAAPNRARVNT